MPFPLHLVRVHQTSQSTMRHLPQASEAAHTSYILGFFCHPWETAWWSGIMRICLTKSCPPSPLAEAVGVVESALELGLNYGSVTNSDLTLGKLLIFFVFSFAKMPSFRLAVKIE